MNKFLVRNQSKILLAAGTIAMICSTIYTIKMSGKFVETQMEVAQNIKEREYEGEVTTVNKALSYTKAYALIYAPTLILNAASLGCFFGANYIVTKKNAILMAASALSESALTDYTGKVIDSLGEKEHLKILDSIAEDKITDSDFNKSTIIDTGNGDTLCFDTVSGRYFYSSVEAVRSAETSIMKLMVDEMYASLNDFYEYLGLDSIKIGDYIGWRCDGIRQDITLSSQIGPNGDPCLVVMDYNIGLLSTELLCS